MIPELMLAIRLAPILLRLIRVAEKYNQNEPYELTLDEQIIVNNLTKVERLVKELEFKETFSDDENHVS